MVNSGLAYWRAAIEGRTELDPEAVARMQSLPGFQDACRAAIHSTLERHRRLHRTSRGSEDISRFAYGYFVLYLDAIGGVTLSRIQQLCSELGMASPGRAQAILFHLRAIGYVQRDPNSTSRRERRYIPTPEMVEAMREPMTSELAAFALIEPEATGLDKRLAEPDFFRLYMRRFGEAGIKAIKNSPRNSVQDFSERNGGLIILYDILASAAPDDVYPPRGRLKMSVTGLARRYQVSRSHIFRILRDAEASGHIKRDPADSTGTLTEKFRADLANFHIFLFMALASCAQYALVEERKTMGAAAR